MRLEGKASAAAKKFESDYAISMHRNEANVSSGINWMPGNRFLRREMKAESGVATHADTL